MRTYYVKKNLLEPDEKILFEGYVSWWTVFGQLFLFFLASAVYFFLNFGNIKILFNNMLKVSNISFDVPPVFFSGFKMFLLVYLLFLLFKITVTVIKIISTELVLTNKRLIFKKGLWNIDTETFQIEKIESIDISKDIIERILGFGDIIVRGIGKGTLIVKNIKTPEKILNISGKE